jgi:hypothetical protein
MQDERSVFLEVIVSVIVRKKSYEHVSWFWMVTEMELFESPDLALLHFCFFGWVKGEVYKRKEGRRDELLVRILDAAASIKKR